MLKHVEGGPYNYRKAVKKTIVPKSELVSCINMFFLKMVLSHTSCTGFTILKQAPRVYVQGTLKPGQSKPGEGGNDEGRRCLNPSSCVTSFKSTESILTVDTNRYSTPILAGQRNERRLGQAKVHGFHEQGTNDVDPVNTNLLLFAQLEV